MTTPHISACPQIDITYAYAAQGLEAHEQSAAESHIAACQECRREFETLRPIIVRFTAWPADVLRPASNLQARLAQRIAADTGKPPVPPARQAGQEAWREPDWASVAPGIEVKMLAADARSHQVSMLVRLAPGASYPAHTHAGLEELHLLNGELWIDERKLFAGDYNRAVAGTGDDRVWSETGCTCLLVTSAKDVLK